MDGDEIGSIADLEISADGRVETILLTDANTVAGGRLRAIGSYAAILNVDIPLRLDCRSLDRDQFADQHRRIRSHRWWNVDQSDSAMRCPKSSKCER